MIILQEGDKDMTVQKEYLDCYTVTHVHKQAMDSCGTLDWAALGKNSKEATKL